MKKMLKFSVLLLAAVMMVSCATTGGGSGSSGRKVPSGFPQFVKDAIKNQPEDALVGVGNAKMSTLSMSRTVSSTRARAEISRQMNTMMKDMVRDYTAGSEVDPSATVAFQENITVALSKSQLRGAVVADQDVDEQGQVWTVVMLSKASTIAEINQAQAMAKLAVPAMASFNAEDRMNKAFEQIAKEEVTVGNK